MEHVCVRFQLHQLSEHCCQERTHPPIYCTQPRPGLHTTFLHNFRFDDLCRSSGTSCKKRERTTFPRCGAAAWISIGPTTALDERHKSCNLKLHKKSLCAILVLYRFPGDWAPLVVWKNQPLLYADCELGPCVCKHSFTCKKECCLSTDLTINWFDLCSHFFRIPNVKVTHPFGENLYPQIRRGAIGRPLVYRLLGK